MEFLGVKLRHEEMHFVAPGEVQVQIYVSQVVDSNIWIVTKHKLSSIDFKKYPVECFALVDSLELAREQAIKLKEKLIQGGY